MALQKKITFYFVIVNAILMVAGDSFKDDSFDREARSGRAGVVFKPLLGKRTYTENREIQLLRMLEAADALKYYYDQLPYYGGQTDDSETQVTRKVIFTPKLGRSSEDLQEEKRYDVDFTPRLGRRQSEPVTASDEQVYRADGNQVDNGRSKYFSPRLGRTVKLTPRLGRAFNYEMYPSKIRLARSTNSTKST